MDGKTTSFLLGEGRGQLIINSRECHDDNQQEPFCGYRFKNLQSGESKQKMGAYSLFFDDRTFSGLRC